MYSHSRISIYLLVLAAATLFRLEPSASFIISSKCRRISCPKNLFMSSRELQNYPPFKEGDTYGDFLKKQLERSRRPKPQGLSRKRMEQKFAVLLMRSSYNACDDMDFIPMDVFQRDFFFFRQSEYEDYRDALPTVKQGDLTDPDYFDFISFAQYATIAFEIRRDLSLIEETYIVEEPEEDQQDYDNDGASATAGPKKPRTATRILKRHPSYVDPTIPPPPLLIPSPYPSPPLKSLLYDKGDKRAYAIEVQSFAYPNTTMGLGLDRGLDRLARIHSDRVGDRVVDYLLEVYQTNGLQLTCDLAGAVKGEGVGGAGAGAGAGADGSAYYGLSPRQHELLDFIVQQLSLMLLFFRANGYGTSSEIAALLPPNANANANANTKKAQASALYERVPIVDLPDPTAAVPSSPRGAAGGAVVVPIEVRLGAPPTYWSGQALAARKDENLPGNCFEIKAIKAFLRRINAVRGLSPEEGQGQGQGQYGVGYGQAVSTKYEKNGGGGSGSVVRHVIDVVLPPL